MSGYIGTQPVPQTTQTRDSFTATSNQTSFPTSGYTPNYLDVFLNGVKLAAADYTATNNSDVVLAVGAATGDILEVVAYSTFNAANVTGAVDFTVTGDITVTGTATAPQINLVNPNNSGKVLVLDVDQGDVIAVGDLEIYDDRTSGIGYMLRTDTSTQAIGADAVVIMDRTGQKSLANFAYSGDTGTAKLRYWDSNGGYDKLSTSLAGISVVGTVTADGLAVSAATNNYASITATNSNTRAGWLSSAKQPNATEVKTWIRSEGDGGIGVVFTETNHNLGFATNNAAPQMTLDTSGNVGIGTAPTFSAGGSRKLLQVTNGASGGQIAMGNNSSESENPRIFSDADNLGFATATTGGGVFQFYTAGSERMRIDSSGNVLVGKTTSSIATAGTALRGDNPGLINSARAGTILELNRLTTDGSIVDLYKDGSTVGSIGTLYSDIYIGTGDTGLKFTDSSNVIVPLNTSTLAERDAAVSLGQSGTRFKDLYLSGGVYLGGTGAANKLDDVETGTWTPATGSSTLTQYQAAWYTKIGNTVTCSCYVYSFGDTTSSTAFTITGLPFSHKSGNEAFFVVPASGGAGAQPSGAIGINARIGQSGAGISFYNMYPNTTGADTLLHSHLGLFHLHFTFTYITT